MNGYVRDTSCEHYEAFTSFHPAIPASQNLNMHYKNLETHLLLLCNVKQHLRSSWNILQIFNSRLSRISNTGIRTEGLLEGHVQRLHGRHVYFRHLEEVAEIKWCVRVDQLRVTLERDHRYQPMQSNVGLCLWPAGCAKRRGFLAEKSRWSDRPFDTPIRTITSRAPSLFTPWLLL